MNQKHTVRLSSSPTPEQMTISSFIFLIFLDNQKRKAQLVQFPNE